MKYKTPSPSLTFAFALSFFMLSGCVPVTHSAIDRVERIVVFGDSNVDTGNLAKLFGGSVPRANMWQGRNSNGPVVTEYLAKKLGAELVTYAVSGALTGDTNIVSLFAPELTSLANTGTLKQISEFKKDGGRLGSRDLVILWAGSNDIFLADRTNKIELKRRIDTAVGNLGSAIDQVTDLGAKKIVIGLRTPRPQLGSDDDLNGQDLNKAFITSIQIRQANSYRDILIFDAYSVIKDMVQRPAIFGFKNVSELCVEDQQCLSEKYENGLNIANTYLNWDAAHKTTRVHSILAKELSVLLRQ